MSEDALRQIMGQLGSLKESSEQRLRGEQAVFGILKDIQATQSTMQGDVRTIRHDFNNFKLAIDGEGGKIDKLDGHVKDHCTELKQIKGYVDQIKGGLKSGRLIWALITFLGVGGISAGAAWFTNSSATARANDLEHKVLRIERSLPRSFPGLQ
jgi:hypothetical protein